MSADSAPTRPRLWNRRGFKILVGCLVAASVGMGCGIATIDRWLFVALDPGAFDATTTPPAPDYKKLTEWAAHPSSDDGSDVAISALPATKTPSAPVFYVHPTTSLGPVWNVGTQDAVVVQATERGGTLIQASAFNGCCVVYAPRYRQANGKAFITPNADGDRAIAVALGDVDRAFDVFLNAIGDEPFILAGHSQGAILLDKLIEQRIAKTALARRLVVAYLPGAPIREGEHALARCDEPDAVGCMATWHARGPKYVANGLELAAHVDDTMRNRVCVNPVSWRAPTGEGFVGKKTAISESLGAVFLDGSDPKLEPGFLTAQCRGGTLVVEDIGELDRDFMSHVLLFVSGPENYHPIEYQLFYADIRANVQVRLNAYSRQAKTGAEVDDEKSR